MQSPDTRCQTPDALVLVCFALEGEAAPFRKIAAGKSGISILITGIGRRNAGNAVQSLLSINTPAQTLTCGFAGGLNPQLKLGGVIF
jgi:nucleoside phosphorylase